MGLLDVDISSADGRLWVVVAGELDLSTVPLLEDRVEEGLAASPGVVVLDLRGVTFLDSSGLRVMLQLDKRQRDDGGRLVVVRGGRRVARVLELTGVEDRLELIADPSELDGPN